MIEYTVIYERGETNWGAYVPDLPGCVTTGKTLEEIAENMKEAIQFHLDGLQEEGLPILENGSVMINFHGE
ncbi:MAG: type II toxin-antitoxin system HicB family antitoxin [Microcystis panniformis]